MYTYDNDQWLDQLTAVNDTPLTYDANGNLASYGDTTYTWSHGKWLISVTDGENTYSYRYDENGIRAEKYVNGVKTEFNTLNGVLLSQKTGDDFIYFQYDTNGTPIGFVYNDAQYLYMTNQLGDIISITDAQGKELVEYEYDEWGNPLETTLMSDDETASVIAEINPFRYRGYYYDNETGMYYLQSRYYNPELGRFISADDFDYINPNNSLNINAYIYCANNPLIYRDPTGHELTWNFVLDLVASILLFDQISIDMSKIFGENFTENFFDFLGSAFSLIPALPKLFLSLIKSVPNSVWELFENDLKDNLKSDVKIGELVSNASIWFTNAFLEFAAESTFWGAFASWGIGLLPAELAVVFWGLAKDNTLTPSQKFTVLIVDGISIIISNFISLAVAAFDPSKVVATIGTIASFVLPGLTDMITKLIIKKKA